MQTTSLKSPRIIQGDENVRETQAIYSSSDQRRRLLIEQLEPYTIEVINSVDTHGSFTQHMSFEAI